MEGRIRTTTGRESHSTASQEASAKPEHEIIGMGSNKEEPKREIPALPPKPKAGRDCGPVTSYRHTRRPGGEVGGGCR